MTPTDGIIRKIQALLRLAGAAGTEEEANAATGKAQELLATYNLEMHEIEAKKSVDPAKKSDRKRDTYERSALFKYQRDIWEAVANVNFCWYISVPIYKTNSLGVHMVANYHHQFIGSEVNCLSSRILGDFIEECLCRLCPYSTGRAVTSFKEGAAARLVERLAQKRKELEETTQQAADTRNQQTGTCTAIALREVYTSEEDENYRFVYGEEAYQNRLWCRHNHESCFCDRCVAYRVRQAEYKRQEALRPVVYEKKETDAQRRKREERESRSSNRYWDAQDRKERNKWRKKDHAAYVAGTEAAEEIGLDQQVQGAKNKEIGNG